MKHEKNTRSCVPSQGRRDFLKTTAALGTVAAFSGSLKAFASSDVIRIGYVSPKSGPFAPFAKADDFIIEQVRQSLAGGLTIGGKHYDVEILVRDDQSSTDRASNQAADLINSEEVDLMLAQVSIGPSVPQQCELNGVPCISTMGPWEAWMFPMGGKPDVGFQYAYHFFWGVFDIARVYEGMWSEIPTNKKVGMLWSNDVPGLAMGDAEHGMPAVFKAAGYELIEVGKFPVGADDFTAHIQAFKKEGVDIVTGLFNPPEWATFVAQSHQMDFKPKIMTPAKALLFPSGVETLGQSADRMSTEIWWTPAYPFSSSLTGQTAEQLSNTYMNQTGQAWTQPLGVAHALFEAGIQALKNSGDPKNPDAVAEAIGSMQVDSVIGRLDFANGPAKNVSGMRVVGGQWRIEAGKPEIMITDNQMAPEIPVQRTFESL
ncbi:ABC transporter substrate-binding protein [Marinobacterium sedimentorum]|uniref:ABC transporter substrate-binding protein n=1 Tax=Marinobacterium sedimentorum TaxID=2927804 RepID=UPI0020C6FBAD|nr:ABC transporter substrate-binding protein [Marinobacterium sedimentorum]MCP8688718.1 ABC transporter substrate-binding protein [Marinobacterium sedimentorum]